MARLTKDQREHLLESFYEKKRDVLKPRRDALAEAQRNAFTRDNLVKALEPLGFTIEEYQLYMDLYEKFKRYDIDNPDSYHFRGKTAAAKLKRILTVDSNISPWGEAEIKFKEAREIAKQTVKAAAAAEEAAFDAAAKKIKSLEDRLVMAGTPEDALEILQELETTEW